MTPLGLILIILVILLLVGGLGTRYGGWGGPTYTHYGTPGLSIGAILLIVVVVLLLTGRL
jgi:hypothetical protein